MNRDDIRRECWNQALKCFGTAYIFERRANGLRQKLRVLTFLGIATPIAVGSIIVSFGVNHPYLSYIITVAGVLSTVQLIASAWSLVAKWDDCLVYASKSNSDNKDLSLRFQDLAQDPPQEEIALNLKYQLLQTEYRKRNEEDENQGLTEREKRIGMRAGLRQFKRACATCKAVPASMKPSKCYTCGKF